MFDDPAAPVARPQATSVETPTETAAVQRFHGCRWRKAPEPTNPLDYCSHRDVQPMAGTTGFDPEAWCPDCAFYKVRRVPKKRPVDDYAY
jgi:hypothetical protein